MPSTKKININDMPKWFRLLLILAPIAGLILIPAQLDNDFYFIFTTGEYIVKHGFPTTDFLSMHTTMSIIPQQWLTGVLFYFLYTYLGKWGVIGFVYVCYGLLCVFIHKFTRLISDNLFIASLVTFCSSMLMTVMFEKTRPQSITYVILVAELYFLECYVQKKKLKYLFLLPVLSVLQINFHCSMWVMLFVFAAPFAAAALPIKIGKIKQEPCCSFVKLLICGVVCFAVGFLNPYGLKAITYITTSFGYSEIDTLIVEMAKTSMADASGTLFFVLVALAAIITLSLKKRNYSTRYVLLFAGTMFMAFLNFKSIAYFFIGGIPAFSYMVKDVQLELPVDEKKQKRSKKEKQKLTVLVVLFVAMIGVLAGTITFNAKNEDSILNESEMEYAALDDIVEILDKENKDDIILYTGFNFGQYIEFKGYHPYLDGRAELFLKDNNGEFDYLKEYTDLRNNNIYYKDFINKYNFNYLIVSNTDKYLSLSLENDDDFEKLYDSEYARLFKLKE